MAVIGGRPAGNVPRRAPSAPRRRATPRRAVAPTSACICRSCHWRARGQAAPEAAAGVEPGRHHGSGRGAQRDQRHRVRATGGRSGTSGARTGARSHRAARSGRGRRFGAGRRAPSTPRSTAGRRPARSAAGTRRCRTLAQHDRRSTGAPADSGETLRGRIPGAHGVDVLTRGRPRSGRRTSRAVPVIATGHAVAEYDVAGDARVIGAGRHARFTLEAADGAGGDAPAAPWASRCRRSAADRPPPGRSRPGMSGRAWSRREQASVRAVPEPSAAVQSGTSCVVERIVSARDAPVVTRTRSVCHAPSSSPPSAVALALGRGRSRSCPRVAELPAACSG